MDYYNEYHEELNKVGQVLRDYRKYSYLSRYDVEDKYGISRSLVERAEKGSNITLITLFRLCDIYDLSPAELMDELENS